MAPRFSLSRMIWICPSLSAPFSVPAGATVFFWNAVQFSDGRDSPRQWATIGNYTQHRKAQMHCSPRRRENLGESTDRGLTIEVEKVLLLDNAYWDECCGETWPTMVGAPHMLLRPLVCSPSFQELESLSASRTSRLFSPQPGLGGAL